MENFKLISRIIALDSKAIHSVAKKKSATADGALLLFLTGIMSVIGARSFLEKEEYSELGFEFTLNNVLFLAILAVVAFTLYFGISYLVARALGGNCKFKEYFRAMSFASIVNGLAIFAPLTFVANVWMMILNFQILKALNRFNSFQTTLTIMASWLSIFALIVLLS